DQQGQVIYDDGQVEQTRKFSQNDYPGEPRQPQFQHPQRFQQNPYEPTDNTRVMANPYEQGDKTRVMPNQGRMQPRQDIGGSTRPMHRENLQEAAYRSHPADSTRVFDSRANQAGRTVRMDQNEMRNLLEKEEPILKREYLQDDDDFYSGRDRRRSKKKKRR
ncbi:hypothetical protein EVA_15591, partial [gut metagenome]